MRVNDFSRKRNLGADWLTRLHYFYSNTKRKVDTKSNFKFTGAARSLLISQISYNALNTRLGDVNDKCGIPVQVRSVPIQVPFSAHLLTTEPFASNPSSHENLHSVLYNISVVLHPNSSPLDGGDKVGHVTAKWVVNQWFTLSTQFYRVGVIKHCQN